VVRRLSSDDTSSALEEPDTVLGRQLPSIDTDAGLQLGQDLETMVHRISVDMEDRFGTRPSMEELAAGLSLFSANEAPELQSLVAQDPAQTWCEQRLDHAVKQLNKGSSAPSWCRADGPTTNRTVISASTAIDFEEDESLEQEGCRSSLNKSHSEDADLAWLRSSSSAAVQAIQDHQKLMSLKQSDRATAMLGGSTSWQLHSTIQELGNAPSAKSTIKAQWKADP